MAGSSAHVWTNETNLLKNRIEIVLQEITKLEFLLLSSLEIQNSRT